MGTPQILLAALVILVPLAIAVAVTLWTLEPAAQRAERAKRARKPSRTADAPTSDNPAAAEDQGEVTEDAERDHRPTDSP